MASSATGHSGMYPMPAGADKTNWQKIFNRCNSRVRTAGKKADFVAPTDMGNRTYEKYCREVGQTWLLARDEYGRSYPGELDGEHETDDEDENPAAAQATEEGENRGAFDGAGPAEFVQSQTNEKNASDNTNDAEKTQTLVQDKEYEHAEDVDAEESSEPLTMEPWFLEQMEGPGDIYAADHEAPLEYLAYEDAQSRDDFMETDIEVTGEYQTSQEGDQDYFAHGGWRLQDGEDVNVYAGLGNIDTWTDEQWAAMVRYSDEAAYACEYTGL